MLDFAKWTYSFCFFERLDYKNVNRRCSESFQDELQIVEPLWFRDFLSLLVDTYIIEPKWSPVAVRLHGIHAADHDVLIHADLTSSIGLGLYLFYNLNPPFLFQKQNKKVAN